MAELDDGSDRSRSPAGGAGKGKGNRGPQPLATLRDMVVAGGRSPPNTQTSEATLVYPRTPEATQQAAPTMTTADSLQELISVMQTQQMQMQQAIQAAVTAAQAAQSMAQAVTTIGMPQGTATPIPQVTPGTPQQHASAPTATAVAEATAAAPRTGQQLFKDAWTMPANLQAKLKKVQRSYMDHIHKSLRTEEKIKTVQQQLDVLNADGYRFPTGVRPFNSQNTFTELDCVASATTDQDFMLHIIFKQGSSRRDITRMMYHHYTRLSKEIELEALQEHHARVKTKTSKATFLDDFDEAVRQAMTPLGAQELGLEEPTQRNLSQRMLMQKSEQLYQEAVANILEHNSKRKKAADQQEAKKKNRQETLLSARPQELFQKAIQAAVKSELEKSNEDMLDDVDPEPEEAISNLLKSWPTPAQSAEARSKAIRGKGKAAATPKPKQHLPKNGQPPGPIQSKGKGQGGKQKAFPTPMTGKAVAKPQQQEQWQAQQLEGKSKKKGKGKGKNKKGAARRGKGPHTPGKK